MDSFRPWLCPAHAWSVFADASWRVITPPQARAVFGLQGTHRGRGALFLSADLPDWCSEVAALSFEIPPTLPVLGGSPLVAELLAIHAGLLLLHTLGLRGTVFSDCLSAVKKINRKWTPGHSFQAAGASLVSSCRAYLSSTIALKWVKGHPERSETPPSSWSRQQWGIYFADALSKNRDISSLPFSPIPTIRLKHLSLPDVLHVTPPTLWQWIGPDRTPPLSSSSTGLQGHPRQLPGRPRSPPDLGRLSPNCRPQGLVAPHPAAPAPGPCSP